LRWFLFYLSLWQKKQTPGQQLQVPYQTSLKLMFISFQGIRYHSGKRKSVTSKQRGGKAIFSILLPWLWARCMNYISAMKWRESEVSL
jgi:hypothetical protein